MKQTFFTTLIVLFSSTVFLASSAVAQEQAAEDHVFLIVTYKATMPAGGRAAERDSLLEASQNATTRKNPKILSQRVLQHHYGSDSQQLIVITEYKNWADVEEARKLNAELFQKHWADAKQRQAFNQALGKYFEAGHSDEIYIELPKFRK